MSNLSTVDQTAINWACKQIRAGQTINLTVWHRHPMGSMYSTGGPIGPHTDVRGKPLADRTDAELMQCIANGAGWRSRGAFIDRLCWQYRIAHAPN